MNKITVKNLPEQKFSDVIEASVSHLKRAVALGYGINMGLWINSGFECTVCLGGACLLGFVPDKRVKKAYSDLEDLIIRGINEGINEEEEDNMLNLAYSLNQLRQGSMSAAIDYWNQIANERIESPTRSEIAEGFYPIRECFIGEVSKADYKKLITYLNKIVKLLRKHDC